MIDYGHVIEDNILYVWDVPEIVSDRSNKAFVKHHICGKDYIYNKIAFEDKEQPIIYDIPLHFIPLGYTGNLYEKGKNTFYEIEFISKISGFRMYYINNKTWKKFLKECPATKTKWRA